VNYGINLDLQLRGQEKFARAIRQVEQLESALKRVKQEIDISGKLPGTGRQNWDNSKKVKRRGQKNSRNRPSN
jgi:hypothetical protein